MQRHRNTEALKAGNLWCWVRTSGASTLSQDVLVLLRTSVLCLGDGLALCISDQIQSHLMTLCPVCDSLARKNLLEVHSETYIAKLCERSDTQK